MSAFNFYPELINLNIILIGWNLKPEHLRISAIDLSVYLSAR